MSFIKLDRGIKDWEWFADDNMLKLWIYILASVNYEDKQWQGISVPKGSMITSLDHLALGCGMSVRNVRTCLDKLQKTKEISLKSTNKFTQIYAIKWGEYQCSDVSTDKQLTNNRQTTDKQLTTTKEYIRNKRNKEDILPTYDTSINKLLTTDELQELFKLRKGKEHGN